MATTINAPSAELLPDPEPAKRRYTVISVDDHLVEPANMFEGRMPARFVERAPKIITLDNGGEAWLVDGIVLQQVGFNATAGRVRREGEDSYDPISFATMRRSAWDISARIADMNLDGVYASLCFPSFLGGFGGVRLQHLSDDRDFALALVNAWNDWHIEEWAGAYPERIIPCQITWLHDAEVAAGMVRRNASRGFKALTFPESPHQAGLPTLHSGYWDPLVAACAETDTVICVHTGSSGTLPETAVDAPRDVTSALFGAGYSLTTTVDWLYSRYAVKHPNLKIVITEGGIGWVPSLLDRLDHHYAKQGDRRNVWAESDLTAAEVLQRNFYFCLLDEPSAMVHIDRIGADHIFFETDFPHSDASWPHTQDVLDKHFADTAIPQDVVDAITWRNASNVFRHAVPEAVQRDPYAY
jgi:predicted TIM-barrel fold metal-dependent hydrolase